jgi:hypothetical protein
MLEYYSRANHKANRKQANERKQAFKPQSSKANRKAAKSR